MGIPGCQLQPLALPGWGWQQHSVLLQVLLLLNCRIVPAEATLLQLLVHLNTLNYTMVGKSCTKHDSEVTKHQQ
jgi:hypothetical protein